MTQLEDSEQPATVTSIQVGSNSFILPPTSSQIFCKAHCSMGCFTKKLCRSEFIQVLIFLSKMSPPSPPPQPVMVLQSAVDSLTRVCSGGGSCCHWSRQGGQLCREGQVGRQEGRTGVLGCLRETASRTGSVLACSSVARTTASLSKLG